MPTPFAFCAECDAWHEGLLMWFGVLYACPAVAECELREAPHDQLVVHLDGDPGDEDDSR
jgi:hypothetical protein